MRNLRGLTLVELMVVLAISALLVTLAAPSFTSMIRTNSVSGSVNTFLSDVRYARSEAIRLGGGVTMCRSDDPEAASPACGSGNGPGNNGWVSGWIIFHDLNNDGTLDAGEAVLRVQPASTAVDQITEVGAADYSTKLRFTGTGRLLSSASATTLRFGGYATTLQRTVCLSIGGRARVAGDGSATCE